MDFQINAMCAIQDAAAVPSPLPIDRMVEDTSLQAPLAMAYVPVQQWDCIYDNAMQSLYRGTIFPALDKPCLEGVCPNA